MKKSVFVRFSLTFLMVLSLFSPTAVLAMGDGKKHFKAGLNFEVSEDWDKAAEEFALAITGDPKNPEYRLHYQRALFNASQMYMKRATTLANEKDYAGAYIAFRKAYGFDPVNELAKSEMERMLRLQQALQNGENPDGRKDENGKVKLVQTGYSKAPQDVQVPQRLEKLRDVPFPGGVDIQFLIKELAKDLDLNVLFEAEGFRTERKIKIELKNVTAAKALDYIFLQEGLFFQKVGPRTILVAQQAKRQNFQQLILRTFYLANASPKDVAKVVQTAIPAQPGRTPTIVLTDDATNSITIRDTEENIRLMAKLISSLDKDRAEVVMDVAIYEVNKQDLMRLGAQVGDANSLVTLGGSNRGLIGIAGNNGYGGASAADYISRSLGAAIAIPSINIAAFQNKQNSKLIASTQIHAFNNEDSSARIGQRVPVRTATFQTGTVNNSGVVSDVINYEQVGLTLKFKPIVFPNQDVQVAMEIESKDVTGASSLTPIFTERTIKGTARVQNNKTLLLASVAQGQESNGRQGIPLLGLIPVLGRLFTAPTKDNRQVDIVIAVTPKVIRAPAILPEDEEERPTGSLAVPTSGSLEAMIIQEDREELLAAARKVPNTTNVQLPDQTPVYVRADSSVNAGSTAAVERPAAEPAAVRPTNTADLGTTLKPIDSSAKTIDLGKTSDTSVNIAAREASLKVPEEQASEPAVKSNAPVAALQFSPLPAMKAGEKMKVAISVNSATAFRSAVLGLRFDEKKLAVRSVSFGDIFGAGTAGTPASPFLNQSGRMFVSLSSVKEAVEASSGVLAYIEIEALADGAPEMAFEKDVLNFLTPDGKNFTVKY